MARRSAVQHGPQSAGYPPEGAGAQVGYAPADPWDAPQGTGKKGKSRRSKSADGSGGWSGSGGRWWVWVGRAILWAFIIVVVVNGIRAPLERFTGNQNQGAGAPKQDAKSQFPAAAASSYALQFAGIYLNYDQATAADREKQLQFFLPDGSDTQFGWNSTGKLPLQSIQAAGVEPSDANNAIVTILAEAGSKWFQLAVPVYAKDGAMVIAGKPALLPPPPRATLPQPAGQDRDSALEGSLQQFLPGFFRAYGGSDQSLSQYSEDQHPITGLAGAVIFSQLRAVSAPRGPADSRNVIATVAWQIAPSTPKAAPGELEQTYALTMVQKNGKWYVRDIRGSTQPAGS